MIGADIQILMPEIVLAVYAMGALMAAVYTTKDGMAPLLTWATSGLFVLLAVWIGINGQGTNVAFGGMFVDDGFARFAKIVILLSAAAVLLMSESYMQQRGLLRFEYPILVALAVVGMMVMVSAGDLTVAGFYPDDGDNDLRVHAEVCGCPVKNICILFPEGCAPLNAALCQEYFSVFVPGFCFLRRLAHQLEDVVAALRLAE